MAQHCFSHDYDRWKEWREGQLQDYQNYLQSYDINYNSEFARRARLEHSGFSGQYLANGIGSGGGSSATPGLAPIQDYSRPKFGKPSGLDKIQESLALMSNAGIAMKNFGEGKAAMKYADLIGFNKVAAGKTQNDIATEKALLARVANANPNDYGYWRDKETGKWVFTGKGTDQFNPDYIEHSTWMDEKIKKLNGMDLTNELRQIEAWEKTLDYNVKQQYQEATAKAQKELLEGKVKYQNIENEYVEALKAMGVAMPIIQLLVKSLL